MRDSLAFPCQTLHSQSVANDCPRLMIAFWNMWPGSKSVNSEYTHTVNIHNGSSNGILSARTVSYASRKYLGQYPSSLHFHSAHSMCPSRMNAAQRSSTAR